MARGYNMHAGITGDPWHRCQRCDCEYQVSRLQWQNGLLLCPVCIDNPDTWIRDTLISEMLTEPTEEAQVAEILRGDTNEPEPPQP
jgi:hypothetical protein